MSYIIAFVQVSPTGDSYPVECFRTDLSIGDEVLVEFPKRRITRATVVELRHLSWRCGGRIKGKVSEATLGEDGHWSLLSCPSVVGMATSEAFISEVKRQGWVPLKRSHVHMAALTNSNQTLSANILVRRNGIDLQMLPARRDTLPRPFSLNQESISEGRVVRHYFAHTTFNLYEGILRFAASFMSNEGDYDRFFSSVGSSDRRTERQKQEAAARKRARSEHRPDALSEYYRSVSNGSGTPVYLGDGMWIGAGGSVHDWDR